MVTARDEYLAVQEQQQIGWCRVFNGHLSKHWATIQDDYLSSIKLHTKRLNGSTWATYRVKLIWAQLFKLWTMRNETRNTSQDD
eukprot:13888847-Ditylum_brightwellii.AAC.1